MKLAVLDVYMKKKYPALAATFAKSTISSEVAAVLRSFFNKGLASEQVADFVNQWSGIYIAVDTPDAKAIVRMQKRGEVPKFSITAIMLRSSDRPDFCVAHKVVLPFKPEYMHENARNIDEWYKVKALIEHHSPRDTKIYSGIALVPKGLRLGSRTDIRLSLMLRDRTTYEPCLGQLEISRATYHYGENPLITQYSYECVGELWGKSYFYCNNFEAMLNIKRFSSNFIKELESLYDMLGEEI